MSHKISLASLLTAFVLAGCGGGGSPPPAAPSASTAGATQDAVSRIGDVSIRASVVQTSSLPEQVAAQYGIARDDRTVMLLVAVRQGPEAQEVALPAQITATATDLRGRRQTVSMRELRTGAGSGPELLDYIGTVDISLPDTLRFDLTIVREGGATSSMQFSRDFYPR
ncbi:DUF4426 domain-containing protein [Lysobacter niastensis]|uniref:DUF4426 domain-containing protein n=1 Tax=Lysobacter niastensis TaxID=380629 RepID=A0ABS0B4A8_9GAMM|nr:DUF4426 domain-containing protein [Lysobacter niastensis]MBF6022638.1 DUF4426 domain-containing protein [Lysobacter niastensis]